jgi:hypothetical protein
MSMMKKQTKTESARSLRLNNETLRKLTFLSDAELGQAGGARMHTSFSCSPNLCTTH